MDQLPVFLNLKGMSVLLVGDGEAAEAKRRLIEGAGGFITDDPDAARIAFIAADASPADIAVLHAQGLLVNVVDRPDLCDFTVPAIVDRSPVIVAVGTGGASATLAKALRERLEALLPATLGDLARSIRAARDRVTDARPTSSGRRRFWDRLLAPGAPLDPLQDVPGAPARIDAALALSDAPESERHEIVVASDDPDDLTLRQLRLLSRADTIICADVAAAIIDRSRRDAVRLPDESGGVRPGLTVIVRRSS
ncbi:precorrin-2 dehydrogenase/sirohydrochlorin ferrochelatase family protein [Sphingosinicella soli]|uniref:precorrin-2 dehydrogenase n=1 Tax=Sphingosinicella soli TaxID=333708 RepID=A0A7W7F6V3_9SPHN|nr:bifunctional precorrin-2 dehydrogenase/sirohydrochlorin ferrochelatase [Sphingosinicella soli]MBB4632104.1 uroporphyrin-III C-methyltransferase/precorrin-2 dehydrogenase/sirohydrochlorin ferrochelatase [Sphingosinicella soli]